MEAVGRHAEAGKPVIGICNGFQILCESHMLPGALMRNDTLQFRCMPTYLRIENDATIFTRAGTRGQVLEVPISHGEGNYFADAETVAQLEAERRVIFRYVTPEGEATPEANPNGSINNIAGIINERGNVLGMMPHPERAGEARLGSTDGLIIFRSMIESAVEAVAG
jgi:phosphoribosylformylglycinamidine synthase